MTRFVEASLAKIQAVAFFRDTVGEQHNVTVRCGPCAAILRYASASAGAIWVPPSGVMPATIRLIVLRSSARRIGTAQWKELSKISTPT